MTTQQKQKRRLLHHLPGRRILLLLQRKSSLPLLLLLLFGGFIGIVFFAWSSGRPRKHGERSGITLDPKCTAAASSLVSSGINLLALDFDETIIDLHTNGIWNDTPNELSTHVRPVFTCLLNAAMERGLHVAVVTFSEQENLISNVMEQKFPGHYIPVRGWFDEEGGKQVHIAEATKDIMSHMQEEDIIMSEQTTMLIDDDRRNIKIAVHEGYPAIAFDPDNPWGLLENIRLFRK
mmetsp:Transcript_14630/g.29561  ORF Transcript_14630/g.29561 Transcript_14630/m.29561 type:complete len:235 (+) Transcript_14630:243-947(+)